MHSYPSATFVKTHQLMFTPNQKESFEWSLATKWPKYQTVFDKLVFSPLGVYLLKVGQPVDQRAISLPTTCSSARVEKMRFSKGKLCLNEAWLYVGNAHRFHELCQHWLVVTNGGQFFRRLALFINVDTTNDFLPCFHLSNRASSSTYERWSFQPSPNFLGLIPSFRLLPPFVFSQLK